MSQDVYMEIDWDNQRVTIVPAEGGVYDYSFDEVPDDVIDRLLSGSDYVVYTQGEMLTKEEFERLQKGEYFNGDAS